MTNTAQWWFRKCGTTCESTCCWNKAGPLSLTNDRCYTTRWTMPCHVCRRSTLGWTTHGPARFAVPFGQPTSRWTSAQMPEWAMQPLWLSLWIEERTGGSFWRPHYSKCCASGKILLPPIRTSLKYMAMLQDWQNAERKHFRSYNAAFAFTSTRV